jgi:hypothetical protein
VKLSTMTSGGALEPTDPPLCALTSGAKISMALPNSCVSSLASI